MLQLFDAKRRLGNFAFVKDSLAVNSGVRLKLQPPVQATVSVTDAFGKPLKGAQVQMRVTPRPDEAWSTVGATHSSGKLQASRLYPNGVYTFRATLAGYKTSSTAGLPRVGSKSWINVIEITMEKNDAK